MPVSREDLPLGVYFTLCGPPLFLWAWSVFGLLFAIELAIPGLLFALALKWAMEHGFAVPLPGSIIGPAHSYPLAADAQALFESAFGEARRRGQSFVGTEHLLLAMALRPGSAAARYLAEAGSESHALVTALEFVLGGDAIAEGAEPALTPRAARVLELAVCLAAERGRDHAAEADLLEAIMQEGEGVSAGIIRRLTAQLNGAERA